MSFLLFRFSKVVSCVTDVIDCGLAFLHTVCQSSVLLSLCENLLPRMLYPTMEDSSQVIEKCLHLCACLCQFSVSTQDMLSLFSLLKPTKFPLEVV